MLFRFDFISEFTCSIARCILTTLDDGESYKHWGSQHAQVALQISTLTGACGSLVCHLSEFWGWGTSLLSFHVLGVTPYLLKLHVLAFSVRANH